VDLIVRGICCLRPGVPGVSENIRVRSIVGRFLEHSRVFVFHSGGKERVYLSSADWMERSFFRRVETCLAVEDERLRARVVHEALQVYLGDGAQAWILQPDGSYRRQQPDGRAGQDLLLESLADM
jgi:polyphosphate kinase